MNKPPIVFKCDYYGVFRENFGNLSLIIYQKSLFLNEFDFTFFRIFGSITQIIAGGSVKDEAETKSVATSTATTVPLA